MSEKKNMRGGKGFALKIMQMYSPKKKKCRLLQKINPDKKEIKTQKGNLKGKIYLIITNQLLNREYKKCIK